MDTKSDNKEISSAAFAQQLGNLRVGELKWYKQMESEEDY